MYAGPAANTRYSAQPSEQAGPRHRDDAGAAGRRRGGGKRRGRTAGGRRQARTSRGRAGTAAAGWEQQRAERRAAMTGAAARTSTRRARRADRPPTATTTAPDAGGTGRRRGKPDGTRSGDEADNRRRSPTTAGTTTPGRGPLANPAKNRCGSGPGRVGLRRAGRRSGRRGSRPAAGAEENPAVDEPLAAAPARCRPDRKPGAARTVRTRSVPGAGGRRAGKRQRPTGRRVRFPVSGSCGRVGCRA